MMYVTDVFQELQFWVYGITIIFAAGAMYQKLKSISDQINKLEIKQDKHNNLITRVTVLEKEHEVTERQVLDNVRCINKLYINDNDKDY